MYFITPGAAQITEALESWEWIGLGGMRVIRVTAFGSMFLESPDGVFFLDTLEGRLQKVCAPGAELDALLAPVEAQDFYLLAGLVDRARAEGMHLADGQCYDFKVAPVLGGPCKFEYVHVTDFVVAVNIAGQIHDQVRHLPPGTKVGGINVVES